MSVSRGGVRVAGPTRRERPHGGRARRGPDMEFPVDRLKLKDDKELLSPPIVAEPLYGCALAVQVIGFRPHALLSVQVDGTTVVNNAPGGLPLPDGALLPLASPLKPGQKVRARQKV